MISPCKKYVGMSKLYISEREEGGFDILRRNRYFTSAGNHFYPQKLENKVIIHISEDFYTHELTNHCNMV